MNFSIFEVIMLICCGASWPFSILKTVRGRNPTGKSYLFMGLIIIGYIAGCIHKILYHRASLFYLYLINALLVATDFILCVYYIRKRKAEQKQE